jgi:heme-degrading monooxygenase HmoA
VNPNTVIEIAIFRLRAGTERARFLEAARAVDAALRCMTGFMSRELLEEEEGEWVDLIRWASQDDAQRSIEALSRAPEAQSFLELIDPESVRLHHYRTIDLGA